VEVSGQLHAPAPLLPVPSKQDAEWAPEHDHIQGSGGLVLSGAEQEAKMVVTELYKMACAI
jgi:hypothetical protein